MFCRYCGKAIPDDSNFCPACGRQLTLFSPENNSTPAAFVPLPEQPPATPSEQVLYVQNSSAGACSCAPSPGASSVSEQTFSSAPSASAPSAYAPSGSSPYSSAPTAPPMKWYKFLIYFSLFAGAVINFIQAIFLLTGVSYTLEGLNAEVAYSYFPAMQILDYMMAAARIALVVLCLTARFLLAKYREKAPFCLYAVYVGHAVVSVLYYFGAMCIFNAIPPTAAASIIGTLIAYGVMLILNILYFSKRKHLFVY
ncbi:MAG: zinc ribbon domain-containing protein [Acutalibacteraceae bacterium]